MSPPEPQVAVIGGGVVGCAVAHALARRGVRATVLEAASELARGASGSNSGILHTGFDSTPGELETRLILRSAALREQLMDELGVALWRCGAHLRPSSEEQLAAVRALAENAHRNGVEVILERDGALRVPGEAVTNPVAYVHALAAAATAGGGSFRLSTPVAGIEALPGGRLRVHLQGGSSLEVHALVNCAGLFGDEVARMADEELLEVYPRKGEFLVFAPPRDAPLREILLPVPSSLGKGVLVFPTSDQRIVAGPTAREREDKHDWSVEPDAADLILAKAQAMYPALAHAEQIGAYAGLRPAGRATNYLIQSSGTLGGLVHVAAIRSTGLSASLGIGEYVAQLLADEHGIELGEPRALPTPPGYHSTVPWWQRAATR